MPKGGPERLLHDLNQLTIALGNARHRKDSKTQHEKLLRALKTVSMRMGHSSAQLASPIAEAAYRASSQRENASNLS